MLGQFCAHHFEDSKFCGPYQKRPPDLALIRNLMDDASIKKRAGHDAVFIVSEMTTNGACAKVCISFLILSANRYQIAPLILILTPPSPPMVLLAPQYLAVLWTRESRGPRGALAVQMDRLSRPMSERPIHLAFLVRALSTSFFHQAIRI